jgi:hypothetical protein
VRAGASAPIRLTKWKIAALRMIARLEVFGSVARQDFRELGIDHRRWINPVMKWLTVDQAGRYVRGPELRFHEQHPDVFARILVETKRGSATPARCTLPNGNES